MASPTQVSVTVLSAGEGEILAAATTTTRRRFLRIHNTDLANEIHVSVDGAAATVDSILIPAPEIGGRGFIEWQHPHVPQGAIRGLAITSDVEAVIEVG